MRELIVLTFFCVMASCTSDKVIPPVIECIEPTPTWDGGVDEVVELTCAYVGCHISGTSAPGNYSSYNGVLSALNNRSFENRVFETRSPVLRMPPNYANGPTELTEEQMTTLRCWIDAGFPEN